MKLETVKLEDLRDHPDNPRIHPDAQIAEMSRSLAMFGQIRPVVIDEENTILAGHGIKLALYKNGATTCQALRVVGLSPKQKNKLLLADNKLGELGQNDHDKILSLIRDIGEVDIPGFDEGTLSQLLQGAESLLDSFSDVPPVSPPGGESFFDRQRPATQPEPSPSQPLEAPGAKQPASETVHKEIRIIQCPHCGGDIQL